MACFCVTLSCFSEIVLFVFESSSSFLFRNDEVLTAFRFGFVFSFLKLKRRYVFCGGVEFCCFFLS